MTNNKIYILTKQTHARFKNKDGFVLCNKYDCNKPIQIGDKYVSKSLNNYTNRYHVKCAKEVRII